jgi:hypothetical protein
LPLFQLKAELADLRNQMKKDYSAIVEECQNLQEGFALLQQSILAKIQASDNSNNHREEKASVAEDEPLQKRKRNELTSE